MTNDTHLLRPVQPGPTRLSQLFSADDVASGAVVLPPAEAEVTGITLDSRTVTPGDLYVALSGTKVHGARFAAGAAQLGAAAFLTDPAGGDLAVATGLPVVVAADARDAMADAAATLFGTPTHDLVMFGITGTNGKTTTCFLLEAALAGDHHVGTIGTNGFRLDGEALESNRTTVTTPESPDLQALLAVMLERGADVVAMEVSSHALALQRVDHVGFDVAAFTNLGRDHLDFHPTLEDYFEAKAKLFDAAHCRVAVVNTDDEHGRLLAERIRGWHAAGVPAPRLVTTGFGDSDHRILASTPDGVGMRVRCSGPYGEREFTIDLPGEHNVRNAVMALAMVVESPAGVVDPGAAADRAIVGLSHAQVPGRMQLVRLEPVEAAPTVYVDFAHTPQAIENAVASARPADGGRVIVVVGAGGDRDAAKRGPMGAAAARADLVVVTDDNPRTEDPAPIRAAVAEGARQAAGAEVLEVAGRRAAIGQALRRASLGDVVLVLGKGHEKGQDIGDVVHDFDDVAVVREEWTAGQGERR